MQTNFPFYSYETKLVGFSNTQCGIALGCQREAMAQLPASRPNTMSSFSRHISHLASVWQRFQLGIAANHDAKC
jgi:hypothetical protein